MTPTLLASESLKPNRTEPQSAKGDRAFDETKAKALPSGIDS